MKTSCIRPCICAASALTLAGCSYILGGPPECCFAYRCPISESMDLGATIDTLTFTCSEANWGEIGVWVDYMATSPGITVDFKISGARSEYVLLDLDSSGIIYPDGEFRLFETIQIGGSSHDADGTAIVKTNNDVALDRWLGRDTTTSGYLHTQWSKERPLRIRTPTISKVDGGQRCDSRVIYIFPPSRRTH